MGKIFNQMSSGEKIRVCKLIEEKGGGIDNIETIAAAESYNKHLLHRWYLEYKAYGADYWETSRKTKLLNLAKARKSANKTKPAASGMKKDMLAELVEINSKLDKVCAELKITIR